MKLTLENFQIHKTKIVDIPEGKVTYVEGDSDTGKSSVLRALRWVTTNKPDGGQFVTFGSKRGTNSVVTLEIDGHTLKRERGKARNIYELDGETFTAFGRDVPDPISKFLNLSPYAFQLQGEPPFLIGATPTETAKILSEACGLGVIDTAVGYIREKMTANNASLRKIEILLQKEQEILDALNAQKPIISMVESAAQCSEEIKALQERAEAVEEALGEEPQGKEFDVVECRQMTNMVASLRGEIEALSTKNRLLRGIIASAPSGNEYPIAAIYEQLELVKQVFVEREKLSKEYAKRCEALLERPQEAEADLVPILAAKECLRQIVGQQEQLQTMLLTVQTMLSSAPSGVLIDTTELEKQKATIKVCPTCGREL